MNPSAVTKQASYLSTKEARLSKPEAPSAPSRLFTPVLAPRLLTSCPPTQKAGQHSNTRLD